MVLVPTTQLCPWRESSHRHLAKASQLVLAAKNLPAKAEDRRDAGLIPGLGIPPGGGHGNPFQYSCLENPYGQRSLAGCSPWGHRVGLDRTTKHTWKIARRNNNNLRYADDTTFMAESEEELNSRLMKVKDSEKAGLNSTFKKQRSWHPVPSLHGK